MDDIDLQYPTPVLYQESTDNDVVVRLLTAVHIACVDAGGSEFGLEYCDAELDPFWQTENVHSYFRIVPSGSLAKAVKTLGDLALESIDKGKLKALVLRASLDGVVSLVNTWMSAVEFESWCECRGIPLGESWSRYWEQEHEILFAGAELSGSERRRRETPKFAEASAEVAEDHERGITSVSDLIAELAAYRGTRKRHVLEKPIATRERNTLLTIIAALCKDAGYDVSKHSKTAGLIRNTAASMGVTIGETTIEMHLKKIPYALEARTE